MFKKKVIVLSTEFLVKKLPKKFLEFCSDICFFEAKVCSKKFDSIKNVALVLKSNFDEENLAVSMCKNLMDKGCKLVFIPLHLREDYKFCLKLAENLKS